MANETVLQRVLAIAHRIASLADKDAQVTISGVNDALEVIEAALKLEEQRQGK